MAEQRRLCFLEVFIQVGGRFLSLMKTETGQRHAYAINLCARREEARPKLEINMKPC